MNHTDIWQKCLAIIRDNIDTSAFNTWFAPIIPLSYENDTLLLQVPTQYFYEFIEDRYIDLVALALKNVTKRDTRLRYRVAYDKTDNRQTVEVASVNAIRPATVSQPKFSNPFVEARQNYGLEDIDPQLKWEYNFDHFLEGESNKLARAAAISVAQKPGQTPFNPLFVYGPSGVGKTHLVNAIGVAAKNNNPRLRVLYLSANLFQLQFTEALRRSKINDFIHFYQTIDLLIMDDVQEILGKKATQNAFFNIFNHLHQCGKQVVLTCDRMPAQIRDVEERLLTRFKWGLVAGIERPDFQLRKSILKHKIYNDGLDIPDSVVDYLAENIVDNIRDLEGAIVSLMAQATFGGKNIDLELARSVVEHLVSVEPLTISLEQVKSVVCDFYNISSEAIDAACRKQEIVRARQVAMYLGKTFTSESLESIGRCIGGRNHATVSHACETIRNLMETDKVFCSEVKSIESRLRS